MGEREREVKGSWTLSRTLWLETGEDGLRRLRRGDDAKYRLRRSPFRKCIKRRNAKPTWSFRTLSFELWFSRWVVIRILVQLESSCHLLKLVVINLNHEETCRININRGILVCEKILYSTLGCIHEFLMYCSYCMLLLCALTLFGIIKRLSGPFNSPLRSDSTTLSSALFSQRISTVGSKILLLRALRIGSF